MHYQIALLAVCMSACASMPDNLISAPRVKLNNVQVVGLGFKSQTFLLSFSAANPNSFPLPVRSFGYGVKINGQRFASGETVSELTFPANGSTNFAISVDLNLLHTSPQLLSIVRDGNRGDIAYELEGHLGVDIPLTPPIRYRSSGNVRLNSE